MKNNKNVFSLLGSSNHTNKQRQPDDFYETPSEAVEELLKYEKFEGNLWECACGKNAIVNVLRKYYDNILFSDLEDREIGSEIINFLESDRRVDNIITNPPFKLALKFLKHGMNLINKKMIMLLRIQFLEGKERYEIFKKYPPARIYVFANRVNPIIDGKSYGSSAMCLCWFVWDKDYVGEPIIRWLKY